MLQLCALPEKHNPSLWSGSLGWNHLKWQSERVREGGRASLQFKNISLQVLTTIKLAEEESEAALYL